MQFIYFPQKSYMQFCTPTKADDLLYEGAHVGACLMNRMAKSLVPSLATQPFALAEMYVRHQR